jgi:Cu-processing system permease protein
MRAVFAIAGLLVKEIFRKKDFYVAFVLMAALVLYAAGLDFYDVRNVTRYLLELGLTLVYFFSVLLTVTLCARQYPAEKESRTLQALLAKPVTRGQFVLGKFAGGFAAGTACFVLFFVSFFGVAAAKGARLDPAVAAQAVFLFTLNLAVVAAMASGLSYYLTPSANSAVTLVLYVLVNAYGQALKRTGAALYYSLPHFEFFDLRQRLIHGWGPVGADLCALLAAYAAAYAALFLFLGWLKFRRETL